MIRQLPRTDTKSRKRAVVQARQDVLSATNHAIAKAQNYPDVSKSSNPDVCWCSNTGNLDRKITIAARLMARSKSTCKSWHRKIKCIFRASGFRGRWNCVTFWLLHIEHTLLTISFFLSGYTWILCIWNTLVQRRYRQWAHRTLLGLTHCIIVIFKVVPGFVVYSFRRKTVYNVWCIF